VKVRPSGGRESMRSQFPLAVEMVSTPAEAEALVLLHTSESRVSKSSETAVVVAPEAVIACVTIEANEATTIEPAGRSPDHAELKVMPTVGVADAPVVTLDASTIKLASLLVVLYWESNRGVSAKVTPDAVIDGDETPEMYQ
jgi:hypothetical protein